MAVVGASPAGLTAARELRRQGFDGRLVIVGAEPHRPYGRPPLSKEFLAGTAEAASLALEADGADLGADGCSGPPPAASNAGSARCGWRTAAPSGPTAW